MSLKRNNGTTKTEIGKLYRNNGTNKTQIVKAYRNNGTTKSLIYSAEKLISDTTTNLWGTPSMGGSIADGGWNGGINANAWSVWSDYRDTTFSCPNSVPTDGYKTLYVTYRWSTGSYGKGSDNVGIAINGTTIDRSYYSAKSSGEKTISYDVSSLSTMKLSGCVQTTDPGGGSSMSITITRTWLE